LWINYSRRGWKRQEPLDDSIPTERLRLLRTGFELLIEEGILTPNQILQDLSLNQVDIEELTGLSPGYLSREFGNIKLKIRSEDTTL
jgi:hypothetical protein